MANMTVYFCIISAFIVNIVFANTLQTCNQPSIYQMFTPIVLILFSVSPKIRHNTSFIFAFILLSYAVSVQITIASEPNTTDIITSTEFTTTEFYSSHPTLGPTIKPTEQPSTSPSPAPTISLGTDEEILLQVTIQLSGSGVDKQWVKNNEATLIQMFKDGLRDSKSITVVIGDIIEIYAESNRRRMATVIGVEVEYLVVIDEATALNVLTESIESGSFIDTFQTALTDNFEEIQIEDDISVENKGIGDGDIFLGNTEATFGEKMASPYILLGLVLGIAGVVWLLFLRSDIENNYPSYFDVPSPDTEMVQQSTASGDKEELQEAWAAGD